MGPFAIALWVMVVVSGMVLSGQPESTVVLLPDLDGKVGRVEVANAGGRTILDSAGAMTRVSGDQNAPSAVSLIDIATLRKTHAQLFAAEPAPPVKFTLYFQPGSTELTPESKLQLQKALKAIRLRKSLDIGIYGHSDRVGSQKANLTLSRARAEVVRRLLLEKGVADETISAASHGEGRPLIQTPDGVAEPRNRRVEIVVR